MMRINSTGREGRPLSFTTVLVIEEEFWLGCAASGALFRVFFRVFFRVGMMVVGETGVNSHDHWTAFELLMSSRGVST
jgi:hypothetical protein